jgi:hypothetical protein
MICVTGTVEKFEVTDKDRDEVESCEKQLIQEIIDTSTKAKIFIGFHFKG